VVEEGALIYNLRRGMQPHRQTEEERGEGSQSRAQCFSFRFLKEEGFQQSAADKVAANGSTEVQGARFCGSMIYLATNVRNPILDEATAPKGSGICNSRMCGKWLNHLAAKITSRSGVETAFFS
jgi:hypothetical protein